MGMFQPQNYGKDFVDSMTGMGNFITGMNKAADDKVQRGIENTRADRTLAAQESVAAATVEKSAAETAKMQGEKESSDLLKQSSSVYSKVANGDPLNDDDVGVLGKMRVKLPYLTNNLADNQALQESHSTLIAANERAKALPPSDQPYKFERGDSPETDKVLDAWNLVVSPDRHKTHVDTTGAVTGTKGAEYSTDQIQAGAGISSEGGAHTAAYFSIVDANGAPINQTDAQGNPVYKTDQAGNPVLDSEGQPIPQRKLVASSVGQTNDPNSKMDFIPADALITKSKLALEQLKAESTLTPGQRAKLKKDMEINMYGLMPGGIEKMLTSQVKDNKPVVVSEGGKLVEPITGKVVADNPKITRDYKSRTRQEGGKEIFEESQDSGQTWKKISEGPKFNPRPERTDNSAAQERLRSRRDVATRLREAQRGYQAALKTNDPDAINESIGLIESLNADAREYGVMPQALPVRPYTSAENDTIKVQAVKNLEEKRSKASKVFGLSPSVPAINQEIRRLKQTVKPGKVSFGDTQASTAATADTPPPAGQHAGRTIQDDTTGKKYRSDGSRWVEVK